MKKFLLFLLLVVSGVLWAQADDGTKTLTFDFAKSGTFTGVPTSASTEVKTWSYTSSESTTVSFTSSNAYKNSSNKYLMLNGAAYLTFTRPANIIISSIYVKVSDSNSVGKAVMTIKSGSSSGTQIGDSYTQLAKGENTFSINETAVSDTQYYICVAASKNFQLAQLVINYKEATDNTGGDNTGGENTGGDNVSDGYTWTMPSGTISSSTSWKNYYDPFPTSGTTTVPTTLTDTSNDLKAVWSIGCEWEGTAYFGSSYNPNYVQFGASNSRTANNITLKTSDFTGKIKSVTVKATSNGSAAISVSVGGKKYLYNNSETATATTTEIEYKFTGDNQGEIAIEFNTTASGKYTRIYSISVEYVPDTRADLTAFAFANVSVEANPGTTIDMPTLTISGTQGGETPDKSQVSYSISPELATFSADYTQLTLGADEGTATVTAHFNGDDNYKANNNSGLADASFTLTIHDPSKVDVNMSFVDAPAELDILRSMAMPKMTVTPEDADVSGIVYESSDEKIAKVVKDDEGNYSIEGIAVGKATITATLAATNTHRAATASFEISVVDKRQEATIAFSGLGEDNTAVAEAGKWNKFVAPTLTGVPEGATISYTSSNEKVATVDATGAVTIVGGGTTTITATLQESADYLKASASYTLKAKVLAIAITAVNYEYNGEAGEQVKFTPEEVTSQSFNNIVETTPATLTFSKYYSDSDHYRLYANSTIDVKLKDAIITEFKIVMLSDYANKVKIGTKEYKPTNLIVDITDEQSADFTITNTAQNRVSYIEITYRESNVASKVTFSPEAENGVIDLGADITLNCKTSGHTIYYRFDEEADWIKGEETENNGVKVNVTRDLLNDAKQFTIYAYATVEGKEDSEITKATYTVNTFEAATTDEFLASAGADTKNAYTITGNMTVLYRNGQDLIVANNDESASKTTLLVNANKGSFSNLAAGDVITNIKGTYDNSSAGIIRLKMNADDCNNIQKVDDATARNFAALTYTDIAALTSDEAKALSLGYPVEPNELNTIVKVSAGSSANHYTLTDDSGNTISMWNRYNSANNYDATVAAPQEGKWYNITGLYWKYTTDGKDPEIVATSMIEAVSPVTFDTESGAATKGQQITLKSDADATISWQMTNGKGEAAGEGTTATVALPDELGTYTIKAVASMEGRPDSHMESATYTIAGPEAIVATIGESTVEGETAETSIGSTITFTAKGATSITVNGTTTEGESATATLNELGTATFTVSASNANATVDRTITVTVKKMPMQDIVATNVATGAIYKNEEMYDVASGTKVKVSAQYASQIQLEIEDVYQTVAYGDTYYFTVTEDEYYSFKAIGDDGDSEKEFIVAFSVVTESSDVSEYNPTVSGGTWDAVDYYENSESSTTNFDNNSVVILAGYSNGGYATKALAADGSIMDASISTSTLTYADGMAILTVDKLVIDDNIASFALKLGNKYLGFKSEDSNEIGFYDYNESLSTFTFADYYGALVDPNWKYYVAISNVDNSYVITTADFNNLYKDNNDAVQFFVNNGGTVTTPEVPETPVETEVVIGSTAGEVTLIADTENSESGCNEYAMPVNNAQFTINGQAYTVVPDTKVEYGVVYNTFAQVASGSQGAEGASEINGRMALIMDGGEPQFAVVIPESDIVTISGEGENNALVAVPEIYSESESDNRTEISILGSDKFPAMLEKAVMNTRKVNFTTNEGNDYDVSLYANISADENTDEFFADGDEYTLNNIPADAKTITVETVYLYDEMELILDKTEYTITDAKAPTCTGIEISDAKLVYGEDADNTTGATPLDLSFTLKLNWDDESNLDGYYMGFTVETDFKDDQQGHESSYNFEIDGYTELEEGDSWTSANSWATMGLTSDIKVTLKHALCVDWTNAEDHLNISEKVKDLNLKVNYEVARYVANKNTAAATPRRDISLYSDNSEYTISKESLIEPTEETKSLSDSDVDINTITGIESIMIDANDGSEYYNLQGVRIPTDNLVPGIYIRRNGSNASKIVVR